MFWIYVTIWVWEIIKLKSSIRVTKGLSYIASGEVKPFMDAIKVADILNKLGLEGYTLLPGLENPLTSLFIEL